MLGFSDAVSFLAYVSPLPIAVLVISMIGQWLRMRTDLLNAQLDMAELIDAMDNEDEATKARIVARWREFLVATPLSRSHA
jgi:hypothetical protein